MNNQEIIRQKILDKIVSDWHSFSRKLKPVGVWICEYPTLPNDATEVAPQEEALSVWYLDVGGLQTMSLEEWAKYEADNKSTIAMISQRTFKEGYACFAFYENQTSCYLYTLWGPRWGLEMRWQIRNNVLCNPQRLSVS